MPAIDLNADLGEGFGRWSIGGDEAMLDLVTSASVACGFHAGDPQVMLATVRAAAARGVSVGAHPGYRDLVGFGRRDLAATPEQIHADVVYQVGALHACCRAAGTHVRYVKPHGALYNRAARDAAAADAIAAAVRDTDPALVLLGLAGSELVSAGRRAGLRVAAEAFVDRNYEADGTLTPRSRPDAVLADPEACARRAVRLVQHGLVTTRDGFELAVTAESLCVHGDGPAAIALLRQVRGAMAAAGVDLRPFA
ncbi:MAG TPA: 5-oxoprolinase subunit PxpA [Gemmatimonadales bacterium]